MGDGPVIYRVQEIFQSSFASFSSSRRLPRDFLTAAWSILTCRTAIRGGHIEKCPKGHFQKVWYNSCLHRSCPQCGFSKLMHWLEAKKKMLLPCGHFHLTFPIPSELLGLWRYNRRDLGNLFFQVVASSLREALGDPGFIVGKSGFLLSLHTWNRQLGLHPHIHCLITAGGYLAGHWIPARIRQWLLPTENIRLVYRRHMTEALLRRLEKGELALPSDLSRSAAIALVRDLATKPWIVDRRKRYPHGSGIATYLARYLRGGPINNRRLLSIGEEITFLVSRKKENHQTLTLHVEEFIRRILEHVPPRGFRAIRGYGLYAHTAEEEREECRAVLLEATDAPALDPVPPFPPRKVGETCPICGLHLVATETLPRQRAGPLLLRAVTNR